MLPVPICSNQRACWCWPRQYQAGQNMLNLNTVSLFMYFIEIFEKADKKYSLCLKSYISSGYRGDT